MWRMDDHQAISHHPQVVTTTGSSTNSSSTETSSQETQMHQPQDLFLRGNKSNSRAGAGDRDSQGGIQMITQVPEIITVIKTETKIGRDRERDDRDRERERSRKKQK